MVSFSDLKSFFSVLKNIVDLHERVKRLEKVSNTHQILCYKCLSNNWVSVRNGNKQGIPSYCFTCNDCQDEWEAPKWKPPHD